MQRSFKGKFYFGDEMAVSGDMYVLPLSWKGGSRRSGRKRCIAAHLRSCAEGNAVLCGGEAAFFGFAEKAMICLQIIELKLCFNCGFAAAQHCVLGEQHVMTDLRELILHERGRA